MIGGAGRGLSDPGWEALSIRELCPWAPDLLSVLARLGVPTDDQEASIAYLCEEAGVSPADLLAALGGVPTPPALGQPIVSLEIVGGRDKAGRREPVARLALRAGQSAALVGQTGSGKSQLLADVESMAAGDSPSGRVVLLNGAAPDDAIRFAAGLRPVAQVAQGMRIMLDTDVGTFLEMHARSRGAGDAAPSRREVIHAACTMCGEPFTAETPLASLSGGQSRALMIADAGLITRAPILVIDEIENAGIDRQAALRFLARQQTITLLATHDPLLALEADLRVVLRHGAMQAVLPRSPAEAAVVSWLTRHERNLVELRWALRRGARLASPWGRLERAARAVSAAWGLTRALRGRWRDPDA